MGVGWGGVALLDFIHSTVKVEGSLMVQFFGLVFPIGPPGSFSADALHGMF